MKIIYLLLSISVLGLSNQALASNQIELEKEGNQAFLSIYNDTGTKCHSSITVKAKKIRFNNEPPEWVIKGRLKISINPGKMATERYHTFDAIDWKYSVHSNYCDN